MNARAHHRHLPPRTTQKACFSRELVLHCIQETKMLGNDSATSNWRSIHASSISVPRAAFLFLVSGSPKNGLFHVPIFFTFSHSLSTTISLTLRFDVIMLSRNKRLIAFGFVSWQQQLDGDARVWSPEWAIFQFLAKVSGDKKRTKRKKRKEKKLEPPRQHVADGMHTELALQTSKSSAGLVGLADGWLTIVLLQQSADPPKQPIGLAVACTVKAHWFTNAFHLSH